MLPFGTPSAHAAAAAALDEIDRLEGQLTVYRNDSEVSRLNARAAREPEPVEASLFTLLLRARQLSADTGGAFDVTAGALIRAWGFLRGPRRLPSKVERQAALDAVGYQHLALDEASHSVRFHRPGMELNLGSIGKGYALDRAAEVLRQHGVGAALLHGGHSSVLAVGTPPGDELGWQVGISHPWRPDRRLGVVRLRDRALATSAATFKHLDWNGRKLGHILDPRTGWPAEGMASATILAPTAADADALSTAMFILGLEMARVFLAARPHLAAVLLPAQPPAGVLELMALPPGSFALE